jgi:hypothetical protein
MLKCWKVLIPLKMVSGFEGAIAALESATWSLEAIEWAATTPGVACDGVFCYFARLVTGLRPNALFVVGFAKMHVEMLTHR